MELLWQNTAGVYILDDTPPLGDFFKVMEKKKKNPAQSLFS